MRNDEIFSRLPEINDVPRTRFDRNSNLHTTFDSGKLIPIYLDEVLPGDTFDMKTVANVRMTTPIVPVMDDCFLDTYFFFVPSRLCWNRWKEFCGENPRSNWDTNTDPDLLLPHIQYADRGSEVGGDYLAGSLVDYFGLPFTEFRERLTGLEPAEREKYDPRFFQHTFNMLPFEAYNLIWNEFFRDENIQNPTPLFLQNTAEDDEEALNGIYYKTNSYMSESALDMLKGDYSFAYSYLQVKRACKMHDYFTSCLPQPQKHAPIVLPGFDSFNNSVDVIASADRSRFHASMSPVAYGSLANTNPITSDNDLGTRNGFSSVGGTANNSGNAYVTPINLIGEYNGNLPNINDLRNAFALQRLFEKDARGGSRYIESLRVHFGVVSPDARLQRPEYLGGSRIDINMNQVVQTSSTDEVSPQGNVSGISHTFNVDDSFFKSFTEFGYIIGLAVVRPIHSYQQGVNRMFSRDRRFDFYYPSLAFIGEQPVYTREIYASDEWDENGLDTELNVLGYQEAWADYRYKPNSVTGKMRSGVDGSLDIWHYGDYFGSTPTLSPEFICENGSTVGRSLAVQDEPQFFGDFYFNLVCTRELPLYSTPGLVDHY